jgi:hypothetical protein
VIPAAARGNPEVKHTWLGGLIVKMAGPDGNAPAPKPVRPANRVNSAASIEKWKTRQAQFCELAASAMETDLMSARFKNPFIPIFQMNVYDAFRIIVEHTERHVRQIEERAKTLRPASD